MTEVQKYKQTKAVINDIPNYMEYQPTKEQSEAFDVVLELLNEAIEKATVPCSKCKYYKETDAEWKSGRCLWVDCQTFEEETCDDGESKENELKPTKDLINDIVGFDVSGIKPLPEYKESEGE